MKSILRSSLITVLAGLFLATICLQAQPSTVTKWDIPFSFMVGEANLPAGEYIVQPASLLSSYSIMIMKSRDGKHLAFFMVNPAQLDRAAGQPRLVFTQYADTMYLSQIWEKPQGLGLVVRKSGSQERAARELKLAGPNKPKLVAVLGETH